MPSRSKAEHAYEVYERQLLVDAPIIAVRSDVVGMPGGGRANREIVEHFGACAVVALNERGEIALVRQYRHSVQRRLWELPAGLLDVRDEAPLDCARRELWEEAGLEAQQWNVLLDVASSPGFCDEVVRVFFAQDLCERERPEAVDEEAGLELQWVALDEAARWVLEGKIVNSTAIAGILACAQWMDASEATPLREPNAPFPLRPTALTKRRAAHSSGKQDLKAL